MVRFLVVDDDRSTVDGLKRLLTSDGHEVAGHTDGSSAVDALRRERFDAVITDLEMRGDDGTAVLREARERAPSACLVVVSARAEDRRDALSAAGACMIADKPFAYDEVTGEVLSCRAQGGPKGGGRCHMKSADDGRRHIQLRRR